jgi:alkylation response protein AidB-like acyl-CoA dehydrogenase
MSRYEGLDFFNLEQKLSEEEIMVRDLVRSWVDEKVLPIIEKYYTEGTFPVELIPEIGSMGLFGCNLAGYECAGLSKVHCQCIQFMLLVLKNKSKNICQVWLEEN